jgi:ribA/ribD-fused uncharacterized protein
VSEQFTFFYGGPGSQWYPSWFTIEGVEYNCAEQFMMAEKARLFGDDDALDIIMKSDNPKVQKATGRLVRGFVSSKWEANRKLIVYRANFAKFTQDTNCLNWLLATDGTTLVEASPWDRVWGIGLAANDPRALSRSTWQGSNDLGEIETQVRNDIKELGYR